MNVTVIVVGDEILSGHVQDANAYFIAQRARALGHHLARVTVVGDDPGHIAEEVARAVDGPSDVVFVCGGIGPTHDDRTMEGVAQGLGVPLHRSSDLSRWIDDVVARVERHGVSGETWGLQALRKMELAPSGAEVIASQTGFIPVVTVADPRARVVILPGPPRELQAVFAESVEPRFFQGGDTEICIEEVIHPFFESTLAHVLAELEEKHAPASIGSYPQPEHTLVRICGPEENVRAAAAALRAAVDSLSSSDDGKKLLGVIATRRGRARDQRDT